MLSVYLVAASLALSASAAVTPSEPAPGTNFVPGGPCNIEWTPDTTGTWQNTYIQLMTGSNDDMRHLTTVYHFDGTNSSLTSFSYTCLDVTPHAPILFYQFTSDASFSGKDDPEWTGRFSISDGDLVPAPLTDDKGVAYGIATLVDPSKATPPPPTAPPEQTDSSSGSSGSSASSPAGSTTSVPSGGSSTKPSGQSNTQTGSQTTSSPASTGTTPPGAAVSLHGSFAAVVVAAAAVVAALF